MQANGWKRIAVSAAAVALMCVAYPVQAQVLVAGSAGVTKAADTHPVLAGMVGRKIGIIEVDGEFGKMQNIVPKTIADTSFRVSGNESTAELPTWYGMGSVRVVAPSGTLQPFALAGVGFARLHPQFSVPDNDLNVPLIFGESGDTTKLLFGAGAGVRLNIDKRVFVDGGYKLLRVFENYTSTQNPTADPVHVYANIFYAALGVKF